MDAIICVGAVYIDTILTVPHFPIEDQKLRATKHTRRRGGNCANTLEVLAQLVDAHESAKSPALYLLAVLPGRHSEDISLIKDSLAHVKLDPTCIYRDNAQTAASSYIISSQNTGTRTIVSYNDLHEMELEEFKVSVDSMRKQDNVYQGWFHFEGRTPEFTTQYVEWLRDTHKNFKISVELEKPDRTGLTNAAKLADVVFYSKIWVEAHGINSARKWLEIQIEKREVDTLLCCTWGAEGATAVYRDKSGVDQWARVKGWKPELANTPVVDTVGAGDTFIASMIFAVSHHTHWGLQPQIDFANELAGRKVYQDGFGSLVKSYLKSLM